MNFSGRCCLCEKKCLRVSKKNNTAWISGVFFETLAESQKPKDSISEGVSYLPLVQHFSCAYLVG